MSCLPVVDSRSSTKFYTDCASVEFIWTILHLTCIPYRFITNSKEVWRGFKPKALHERVVKVIFGKCIVLWCAQYCTCMKQIGLHVFQIGSLLQV